MVGDDSHRFVEPCSVDPDPVADRGYPDPYYPVVVTDEAVIGR